MKPAKYLIECAVNEEDHIADARKALASTNICVIDILLDLVHKGEIGLYFYGEQGIVEISEPETAKILADENSYQWSNNNPSLQNYFLFKKKCEDNVWWEFPGKIS